LLFTQGGDLAAILGGDLAAILGGDLAAILGGDLAAILGGGGTSPGREKPGMEDTHPSEKVPQTRSYAAVFDFPHPFRSYAVFPMTFQSGQRFLFHLAKDYFASNPPELMLFVNNKACEYLDTIAGFTEASFAGYARQPVSWMTIDDSQTYRFGIITEDLFFDNTDIAPVDVYGWLMIDPADPTNPLIGFNFPGGPYTLNAGNRLALRIVWGEYPG